MGMKDTGCVGLFRPGGSSCLVCQSPKSSHQRAHRSNRQLTTGCRCGRPISVGQSECEACAADRMRRDSESWLYDYR